MSTKPNPEQDEFRAGNERILQDLIDQYLERSYPPYPKVQAEELLGEMATNFLQHVLNLDDARVGCFYSALAVDHQLRQAFSDRIMLVRRA